MFKGKTWIEPEERSYPGGAMVRKGRAYAEANEHANPTGWPAGRLVAFQAGIPDSFYSIPARVRVKGRAVRCFVSVDDTLDSPTYGALLVTPEADGTCQCGRCRKNG